MARQNSQPISISFNFPLQGLHSSHPVSRQPQQTSIDLNNVRPFDVLGIRARGGQRPGLKKWGDGDQIGGVGGGIGGVGQPVVASIIVQLAHPLPDASPGPE